MSGNPEELLRGALEKIVYFECRLSQLEAELKAAREVAAREKEGAATARAREGAATASAGELRRDLEAARRGEEELSERVRLLEGERERFLAGLIDQARIAGAPGNGGEPSEPADLAGFIAEMRAEIERLRPWKAAAERAGLSVDEASRDPEARPRGVEELASRFESTGRLGLSRSEATGLERALPGRAERSLYQASMDDLASLDARTRRRAAEALRALGSRAAAPIVAAAVGRERDPEVKAALLAALAALAEPAAAEIAARELADPRPPVRAAALVAMAALAGPGAEPRLVAALGDGSPSVRRRAVLLLGFARGPSAEEALASALSDRDGGVARAAALALSGRPSAEAQGALARALDHREEGVRRVAAEAVSRWSGESVAPALPPEERRRASRRIAGKLASLDRAALRAAVVAAAPALEPERARAPEARPRREASGALAVPAPAARSVVAVAELPAAPGPAEQAVLVEVRSALRGRTPEEIAAAVPGGAEALRVLEARGHVVMRGHRYFPA